MASASGMTVQVDPIDNLVKRSATHWVDFAKADTEGGELGVPEWRGETIRSVCPRLAVCICHKTTGPIDIATMIAPTETDYRLDVGHESPGVSATILFAAPGSRREATT